MNKVSNRVLYYDILNIGATIAVIFMHCNGIVHSYSNTLAWKQALVIEVVGYWAVPVFFMLSGATLFEYRKKYSTKVFYKKRILRTVIPFIIWTFISAFIKGINPIVNGWKALIGDIITTKYENVYWFFIPLFMLYLCIPVMSELIKNRNILWYMLGLGFLLNSFLPALFKELQISWNGSITFVMLNGYILYALLGYLLSTTKLEKWQRIIIYALGGIGGLIRYIGTYYLSTRDGSINKTFFGNIEYYTFFLAAAIFVFIKYSNTIKIIENNNRIRNIIVKLSSMSFGVYLTHMIILNKLKLYIDSTTFGWRLLVPFLIYIICLFIVSIVRKIPIIKYIIP